MNVKNLSSAKFLLGFVLGFLYLCWASLGLAAGLSFSPSGGTFATGKTFSVSVLVNSGGGVGINAADGTIAFDPSLLSVVSVSKTNSIFSLWTSEPDFSNTNGSVSFSGGTPTPYTKSDGVVVNVTFQALKEGSAKVTFSQTSILAADGKGTNVATEKGEATFTLGPGSSVEPPAPKPKAPVEPKAPQPDTSGFIPELEMSSPTHSDPEKWYANKNPEIKWKLSPDITTVSFTLDDKPAGDPGRRSEGLIDSKKFNDIGDGVWYFHIRVKDQNGSWSQAVHRKILIDTTSPENFTFSLIKDKRSFSPMVKLETKDLTSGIDKYEAYVNNGEAITANAEELARGTWRLPALLPGAHSVKMKAIDRAGNTAESSQEFSVDGVSEVRITGSPASLIINEPLIVEGTADPYSKVTVRFEDAKDKDKKPIDETTTADQGGKWTYVRKNMDKGEFNISAKMLTLGGAESGFSNIVSVRVKNPPFIARFGWILVVVLLFTIFGCLAYLYYQRILARREKEIAKREAEEARKKTSAVFSALHEEAQEKIDLMDEGIALKLGTDKLSPGQVLDKLNEALDISQSALEKEISDVEKALEE